MDNLCHSLAGAALGEAGLKQRTALGMTTLVIASNLPDIDVAVFATDTLAMSFRRGWTHGLLAMAVLPALFAVGVHAVGTRMRRTRDGPELRLRGLLTLAYVATILHVFMDWLNSYGVRLLMPFSNQWFYGDALYIIDPVLYVIFGAGIVLTRRARGRHGHRRWARLALAAAAVYVVLMLGSNVWARAEVHRGLARAGRGDLRFMVTPVLGNPLRREVIVDAGERYEKGLLWFAPNPHFRPLGYGVFTQSATAAARAAAATPRIQGFLMWSRFPFFVVEPAGAGARVFVNDYRYSGESGRDGWATQVVELP